MDLDRDMLLNALLMCDESQPLDPLAGIGGPVFSYIHTGEEGGFIRHPGLMDGNYPVRSDADMKWLMEKGYIQVRTWGDGHRSFLFELTDQAQEQAPER